MRKVSDLMKEDLQLRDYARRTCKSYVECARASQADSWSASRKMRCGLNHWVVAAELAKRLAEDAALAATVAEVEGPLAG
jgi:hypothetical protein